MAKSSGPRDQRGSGGPRGSGRPRGSGGPRGPRGPRGSGGPGGPRSRVNSAGFGNRELWVSTAPGLEDALLDELTDLGLEGKAGPGGVVIQGNATALEEVLLWSRIAAGVRIRVIRGRVESLDDIGRIARQGNWKAFVHPSQPVRVQVAIQGGRFRHRPPIAKKVEHAIRDALRGPRLQGPRPPRSEVVVHARVTGQMATFSVDVSGDPLFKRGWRRDGGRAPIRENLAAGILRLAEWAPGMPLVDPMCGSGTFVIEAAHIAQGRPVGMDRQLAWASMPCHDPKAWEARRKEARMGVLDDRAAIWGSDREEGALVAARRNAARARVENRVQLRQCAFHEAEPPTGRGLVVVNPPYGQRVGHKSKVGAIYRDFGRAMKTAWSGWKLAILLPSARHSSALDLPIQEVANFKNGSLPVHLFVGSIP